MHRYFKLWISFFNNSLTRDMEYKANFIGGICVDVVFYLVNFLFFNIIYSYVDKIGVFSREDVIIFLIITYIVDGLYMFFFAGNLFPMNRLIVQGDLDFVLLKPIKSQFLISFRYVRTYALITIFALFFMLVYLSIIHPIEIYFYNWIFFFISMFLGMIIWYSIDFIISCLTFWFRNFSVGGWLSHEILKFASRPDSIYTGMIRKVMFSILPMAFVSSVPARILIYGVNWKYLLSQIVVTVVLFLATTLVWRYGLLRYESASS